MHSNRRMSFLSPDYWDCSSGALSILWSGLIRTHSIGFHCTLPYWVGWAWVHLPHALEMGEKKGRIGISHNLYVFWTASSLIKLDEEKTKRKPQWYGSSGEDEVGKVVCLSRCSRLVPHTLHPVCWSDQGYNVNWKDKDAPFCILNIHQNKWRSKCQTLTVLTVPSGTRTPDSVAEEEGFLASVYREAKTTINKRTVTPVTMFEVVNSPSLRFFSPPLQWRMYGSFLCRGHILLLFKKIRLPLGWTC